jgi:hypothetical protein
MWDARIRLIEGGLPGVGSVAAMLIAVMPAIYLGRIGLAGIAPITQAVAAGPSGRPRWSGGRTSGWSEGSIGSAIRAVPDELRANRAPLAALGVVVLAAMALATAVGGAGG